MTFRQFILQNADKLLQQTLEHIGLTLFSLFLAVLVALPLGILITRKRRLAGAVLGVAGVLQTVPSIALLGFMIPVLGIGAKPAIAALFLYALLPIIRNTYTGILEVSAPVKEAARSLGMTDRQILRKVELPLAFPVILAGIRTATVINVGVATLAAYIAAGGLGEFIFGGIALNNTQMILAGAIPAALLAVLLDFLLSRLQKISMPSRRLNIFSLGTALLLLSSLYFVPRAYGGKLLAGFTPEFMGRRDGYPGLKDKYGLDIRTVVISDAVMYRAAYEKDVDVISGYTTDGRIKAFGLTILEDDRHVFPPYYAAPVVRAGILEKYPQLGNILNLLAGRISDSAMTEMNYRVDFLKQSPQQVAKDFLVKAGLWKAPRPWRHGGRIVIGSKIFTEQYILVNMYRMLIRGYSNLEVVTKTGLGGTQICFEALRKGEIDMYPEYTGTGLLVILKAGQPTVDSLISSKEKVYKFVCRGFKKEFNLVWMQPIGFNNAYALMMRRRQATRLGIESVSDLERFLKN